MKTTPDTSVRLPCCIEAEPVYTVKAQYALQMLLWPLGIDPVWVQREALRAPGLYYGRDPQNVAETVWTIPLHANTAAYFAGRHRYDPAQAIWMTVDGERVPVLFGTEAAPDWIASAFFWLSGWQEHTQPERDIHGRFPHAASLQARWNITTCPVVDVYRTHLAEVLTAAGVSIQQRTWQGKAWALCPTHDIDFIRKWRPGILYREGVEYFLRNLRGEPWAARRQRLRNSLRQAVREPDPYRRAFARMPDETQRRGGTGTYFIKPGARSPHDVAYALNGYVQRRLAKLEAAGFEVGLHPSYGAHDHAGYLQEERDALAQRLTAPLVSVRQHYLRYDAATPRLHEAAGFRIDSTLGFSEHEGFRRATCQPFRLFDCEQNRALDVWEMSLAWMDVAAINRRGQTGDALLATTDALLATCRRYGGAAVMLWHNVLWDEIDYPGLGQHFLDTLDAAREHDAAILSLRDALASWLNGCD